MVSETLPGGRPPLPPSPRARPWRQEQPCRDTGPCTRPQGAGRLGPWALRLPSPLVLTTLYLDPAPSGPAPPRSHLQEAGVVVLQSGPDLRCQERGQRLPGQSLVLGAQEIRTGRQGGA